MRDKIMEYKKKLIEVALPLNAINKASVREKSIRQGNPTTLHLWFARRPLAAARAVIWSSLVDDPSSRPAEFPTEESQNAERERLFSLLTELVKWENNNNEDILAAAKAEIMKSTNGEPPPLLDPFAGGGTIPLEAQRLGLEAHASDLNPVAVLINKAMIELPPKFANQPPIHPSDQRRLFESKIWKGAEGLAEDVRYYGEWMKGEAFKRIGHLYPKVYDDLGQEHTVIAWIWTRTVKCPNPACGCQMPLASSFQLSQAKGREAFIQPVIEGKTIRYEVKSGLNTPQPPKIGRAIFKCLFCGETAKPAHVRSEGLAGRMDLELMAIAAEGIDKRVYFSPNNHHSSITRIDKPKIYPIGYLSSNKRSIAGPIYGFTTFDKMFTNRQLTTLMLFSDLIPLVYQKVLKDGALDEYAKAICLYLAFAIDKMVAQNSSFCHWIVQRELIAGIFQRHTLPMIWDTAEANPFSNSSGCFSNMLEQVVEAIVEFKLTNCGYTMQYDAKYLPKFKNIVISCDPPYYDNIGYADLSDFFYIWLRQMLKSLYPDLFKTVQVPKDDELVAAPHRCGGNKKKSQDFFEKGMLETFKCLEKITTDTVPLTVYYAFKQTKQDKNKSNSSPGWEAMLSAIIEAGFAIVGTWPISTERSNRMISIDTNALASSIVLVCRQRPADAPISLRSDFVHALKRELRPALRRLLESNIAPVDLAQCAIGPGMAVYSRHSQVLEADGSPMGVRAALRIINQELDSYLDQADAIDSESRFCLDLYKHNAFNEIAFGDAEKLARARNASMAKLVSRGVFQSQKGKSRLKSRDEISTKIDPGDPIWLLTQQLTHAMENDGVQGVANAIASSYPYPPEEAKDLAYRLYNIASRKNWTKEAHAYNSLVIAWPEVRAAVVGKQSKEAYPQQSPSSKF
jgi:putative DNA methylase